MNFSDGLASVRSAYDTVAESYSKVLPDASFEAPLDRAIINAFIEYVQTAEVSSILDAGCGAGRMTGLLAAQGALVSGVDLSPAMIAIARRKHPDLAFDVADLSQLPAEDDQFGGVFAWYSIIHTAPAELPRLFAEFFRVLASGGFLLLGFQVGEGQRHMANAYGHDISLDAYLFTPESITSLLVQAGFDVFAQMVRAPGEFERTRQAVLLARKGH